MGRGWSLGAASFLPDPHTLFYRPLSRELYFGVLDLLGPYPLVGHLFNCAAIVVAVLLVVALGREVAGDRAGRMAGLVFAGLGTLPVLVGWVSAMQDALAMDLILGSIYATLRGHRYAGLVCFGLGLLAKETTIALFPAVLLAAHLANRRKAQTLRVGMAYAVVLILWVCIHPGVRRFLVAHGGETGGYLGVPSGARWSGLAAGFLDPLNVPLGTVALGDLVPRLPIMAVTLTLGLIGSMTIPPGAASTYPGMQLRRAELATLAGLIALPPLLLTSLFIEHWSPYYACIPALGVALFSGSLLSRLRPGLSAVILSFYLILGVASRVAQLPPTVTTERNLGGTGSALSMVERGFKSLYPAFPARSHIYVSAQLDGPNSVYLHLFRYQPHRVWYRDPSLSLFDSNQYHPGASHEFLFWVNDRYEVSEVSLNTWLARSSNGRPDALAYQKTLRTFAWGRAAAGQTDQAVSILVSMPGRPPDVQAFDTRTAAAILIAAGRENDADRLLVGVPKFDRANAIDAVMGLLAEPTSGLDLDGAAMQAFGLSPGDAETTRALMQAFDAYAYGASAVRFARRLQTIVPGDAEAGQIIAKWREAAPSLQVTVPIPPG